MVGQVVGLHFLHSCCLFYYIHIYRSSKPIIFDVLVHTILTSTYIYMLLNCTYKKNNNNNNATIHLLSFLLFLDGHKMWTKEFLNDDNIQMIIFLLIFFCFTIDLTNGIIDNTTTNPTSDKNSLPIEKLLNQQYDNRQMTLNRTTSSSSMRPWKKSNSIEILKKMIANRQRTAINNRTSMSTSLTSMSYSIPLKSKLSLQFI